MHTHFNLKSGNKKLGLIPVSTTERTSCPPSCPLNDGSCYALSGYFISHHWQHVTNKTRGNNYGDFLARVNALKPETFWRHNQAGDLPGNGELIDKPKLSQLVKANSGKRGFTYSHKHSHAKQRQQIRWANDNGFTVNLSADNLDHADKLSSYEVGPVCVTLPYDFDGTKTNTPQGRAVRVCPAQYMDTSCKDCGLCQKQNRKVIVGFISHGPAKR